MTWVWKTVYQYPQTRSTIPCNYDAKIIVCTILCLLNLGVEDMMLSHWFTQGKTSGYFWRVLVGKTLLLKEYQDWTIFNEADKMLNTLNLTKMMVNNGHILFKKYRVNINFTNISAPTSHKHPSISLPTVHHVRVTSLKSTAKS